MALCGINQVRVSLRVSPVQWTPLLPGGIHPFLSLSVLAASIPQLSLSWEPCPRMMGNAACTNVWGRELSFPSQLQPACGQWLMAKGENKLASCFTQETEWCWSHSRSPWDVSMRTEAHVRSVPRFCWPSCALPPCCRYSLSAVPRITWTVSHALLAVCLI